MNRILKIFKIYYFTISLLLSIYSNLLSISISNYNETYSNYFTNSQININKLSDNELEYILKKQNFKIEIINKIINYKNIHGEILNFEELIQLGLNNEEISILKNFFYIESKRKEIDEIINLISKNNDDFQENIDYYYDLLIYPIDLSKADLKYIAMLPNFDIQKAKLIDNYRNIKPIKNLLELTNCGVNIDDLLLISPFITISEYYDSSLKLKFSEYIYFNNSYSISNLIINSTNNSFFSKHKIILNTPIFNLFYSSSSENRFILFNSYQELISNTIYNFSIDYENIFVVLGYYKLEFGQNILIGSSFLPNIYNISDPPVIYKRKGIKPYYSSIIDYDNNKIPDCYYGIASKLYINNINLFDNHIDFELNLFLSYFLNLTNNLFTNKNNYGINFNINFPINNTTFGTTIFKQENLQSLGLSFYYETEIFYNSILLGEFAFYNGISFVQSYLYDFNPIQYVLTFYYSDTNFNSPNRGYIIHKNKNIIGIFTGFNFNKYNFKNQFYIDLYSNLTNFKLIQNYELTLGLKLEINNFLKSIYIESKEKLSINEENNISSKILFSFEFLNSTLFSSFIYQNKYYPNYKSSDNLLIFRLSYKPTYWLFFSLNFIPYIAKNELLYTFDTPIFFGENNMIILDNDGFQLSFLVKLIPTQNLSLNFRYTLKNSNESFNKFYKNYFTFYTDISL